MAMANYGPPGSSSLPFRGAGHRAQVPVNNAPPGTFAPGTKVQVGSQRVIIEKYLSEGGFAHVYVVRVPASDGRHEVAVLKRVAVPDKDALANMRTEVETMKKLKGHKHIVTYIDSHASQMKGGGYEVFLLMELCAGGGLIDFMNTRLQHRLTEPEILKIFGDVSEGVATMHYLKPPLLHRDLKVENILISKPPTSSSGVLYKLCDFGSTAPPRPAATNASEGRLIEDDIQRHTTLQYRSPEMIDVWRRQPIDEKSDIWALGVLLYKLCYYTTPFEEVGQMAILNASYKYPHHPPFSDRLKRLIGSMLKEDPKRRPNIYQVVQETCSMRGTTVPIKDIYSSRSQSEARNNQQLPPTSPQASSPPPVAGLSLAPPAQETQVIPDIAPMRRGRPTATTQKAVGAKPSPSPSKGDPFAALDSTSYQTRAAAVDQLAAKFPSIDEFSITRDTKGAFPFSSASATKREGKAPLDERLAHALADDAFAKPQSSQASPADSRPQSKPQSRTSSLRKTDDVDVPSVTVDQSLALQQPAPVRSSYASTGTMTTTSPPPPKAEKIPEFKRKPIWRVPSHSRSSSQPRPSLSSQAAANTLQPSLPPSQRLAPVDYHRDESRAVTASLSNKSVSSRPSLEGRRPSEFVTDDDVSRTKSTTSRTRPVSEAHVDSNLDFLREKERESSSGKRPSLDVRRSSSRKASAEQAESAIDDTAIENDTDYLRSIEDSGDTWRKRSDKGFEGHKKRASMPALSLSGTRNAIAGKFGDAFKRFEQSSEDVRRESGRTPSPRPPGPEDRSVLSPVPGSDTTASPSRTMYGSEASLEETEDVPPEVRRELERRRLEAEERRVSEAAAQYRNRPAGGAQPSNRASTIQKRVQSLLDEGQKSPIPRKTAEGYGKYTDAPLVDNPSQTAAYLSAHSQRAPPTVVRKSNIAMTGGRQFEGSRLQQTVSNPVPVTAPIGSASSPSAQSRVVPRPNAPPKPKSLRTGTPVQSISRAPPPVSTSQPASASSGTTPASAGSDRESRLAALLARDQEGVASPGSGNAAGGGQIPSGNAAIDDPADLEAFSRRYPSLNLEMVETEISGSLDDTGSRRPMRIRDI